MWRAIRRLPGPALPAIACILVLMLPALGVSFGIERNIQLLCILALLISGLNLSYGFAGELALGQVAMYAAGAYTAALLANAGFNDLLLELVSASVIALAAGLITGIPGLRLGSWSLAMASFFLVLLIPDLIVAMGSAAGGRNGLAVAPAQLFGVELDNSDMYYVIVVVTALWFVVMRNVVLSRHGIAFRVLRRSPVLASSFGISVYRMKLTAYALGAIPAGMAGVLLANLDLFISPEAFGFTAATAVLAGCFLGGPATVYGALLGAAILQFGPNQSTSFQEYAMIYYGAFLILSGVLLRGGLGRLLGRLQTRLDRVFGVRPAPAGAPVELDGGQGGADLEVSRVSKSFGGNRVLADVSFTAPAGRITALIGPNGSGKTTLLNMVCGFYRVDSGTVSIGEDPVTGSKPDAIARRGVSRTFQTPILPPEISVIEAVAAGQYGRSRSPLWSAVFRTPGHGKVRRGERAQAIAALRLVGLDDELHEEAALLPLGQRRLVELARAVAARPRVILLDEIASGLDEQEVEMLAGVIGRVRDLGVAVVLVEHNFDLVLDIADGVVVLAQGALIADGPPAEVASNPRVLTEYLGTPAEPAEAAPGEPRENRP